MRGPGAAPGLQEGHWAEGQGQAGAAPALFRGSQLGAQSPLGRSMGDRADNTWSLCTMGATLPGQAPPHPLFPPPLCCTVLVGRGETCPTRPGPLLPWTCLRSPRPWQGGRAGQADKEVLRGTGGLRAGEINLCKSPCSQPQCSLPKLGILLSCPHCIARELMTAHPPLKRRSRSPPRNPQLHFI